MKAIDLFAGAGGFSLAAHQAGVDVLAAIELDKAAAETYQKSLIDKEKLATHLISRDINEVVLPDLRATLKLEKGELDLLLGGPPCQGFSSHRINDAGIDDPRNQLLLRYYDFVDEFKPKVFLVENVAGLLWKRHADYLDKFIKLAEDNGYSIKHCGLLNAKDYGVPQNRKRVFILGVRNNVDLTGLIFPPAPTHFKPQSGKTPCWKTASSVFEKMPNDVLNRYIKEYFKPKKNLSYEQARDLLENLEFGEPLQDVSIDKCNIYMKPTPRMEERFKDTPLNGGREDAGERHRLKCHSDGYKGHKDVYGRVFIHLPSNTITTGCNNPSKGRFVHPWKDHGFTLRHAARFQSFPDNFNFYGSTTEQAKQIGNAVPTRLGKILISEICSRLK